MAKRPKIALVLGAGGVRGGAWLVGALYAIARTTGWSPGGADYVIGTSAGAMIGALVGSGVRPDVLVAYVQGGTILGPEAPHANGAPGPGDEYGGEIRLHWSFPRPVLGSPGLALRSLREPWRLTPAGIIAWLPHGVISTQPIRSVIRRVVPSGWSRHRHLWLAATDYQTGSRVVFGREDAPPADLADAVAASCAIPGFYQPVVIGGRRYVDGGVSSMSNLDIAEATDAEIVVCLNPLSSSEGGGLLGPGGPVASLVRGTSRSGLVREAGALEAAGRRVFLVEPHAADLKIMGYNYMSGSRRHEVAETAIRTTTEALRRSELARTLKALAAPPVKPVAPRGGPG